MDKQLANPQRGEVEVVLLRKGKERRFVLRPTFAAVAEIEAATGRGIVMLANDLMASPVKGLSLSAAMAIVRAGLRAAGEDFNEAALQEMVFETGVLSLAKPCSEFLASVIRGGKPAQNGEGGELEVGEAAATETAADTPSVA